MIWLKAHRLALSFGRRVLLGRATGDTFACSRISEFLGLAKSVLTYYGKPFRKRSTARLYRLFVKPGDLVFDIGSHVGNRVVALRSLGARVVAVEPQPLFAAFLERLFAADDAARVLEMGCGSANSRSVLRVSSVNPTLATFSPA